MKKLLLFLFTSLSIVTQGQNPGNFAQSFGSFPGFDSMIDVVIFQNDEKIITCGGFSSFNGIYENKIIRLNPDGTKDTSFDCGIGFNERVFAAVVQPNGKILVGGSFTAFNGVIENRIIRLNSDGTKDTSFNSGIGFNNQVTSIALQSDGKILIGGIFDSYDNVLQKGIIRLNSDGSKDNSFNLGTGITSVGFGVHDIIVQSDNKILLGGNFSIFNGITESGIIRLNPDGSKDADFNSGTGFNNTVSKIKVQSDGKIIVGGNFTTYDGLTANRIIRLNSDGSRDNTFNIGTGFNNQVSSIAIQSDGKILIGGQFINYNGVSENRIIRLNSDGTKDVSFNSGSGFGGGIRSISIQSDGKIIAGGYYTIYNGTSQYNIIRLNTDGTKDINFNKAGFDRIIYEIELQTDGKILIGGNFSTYNGITENRIIRLNPDGSKDTNFNSGIGFNAEVSVIKVQSDGKIIVGGYFTTYNGQTANRIIRLNSDGSRDNTFNSGTGFNNQVKSLALQSDGKILIGGQFTNYNGVSENRIIRLNNDGSKDVSFNSGSGFSGFVSSISIQSDGKIIVGGEFNLYNSTWWASKIIRLNNDGSVDNTFVLEITAFNSTISSIALQSDGKIIVGGYFTTFNGQTTNRIIRLNSNGSRDNTFNIGTGFDSGISSLALQSDEKIIVGGYFTTYNGDTTNKIIRLNSDGTNDIGFETGSGLNSSSSLITTSYATKIVAHVDGRVFVGGQFTTYKENGSSAFLIALKGNSVLSDDNFIKPNQISLWPNPTKEFLNIDLLDNIFISNVKIYDLQGRLQINTLKKPIDVSNLAKGLYIVKVATKEGEFIKKFIKE